MDKPAVVNLDNAEHYRWGGVCDGWHLLKNDGLSVIQERMPPGTAEVNHFHERAHQFFYVLSGVLTMEMREDTIALTPGNGLSVPPETVHRAVNRGIEDAVFMVVSAPKSHGDRVVVEQD